MAALLKGPAAAATERAPPPKGEAPAHAAGSSCADATQLVGLRRRAACALHATQQLPARHSSCCCIVPRTAASCPASAPCHHTSAGLASVAAPAKYMRRAARLPPAAAHRWPASYLGALPACRRRRRRRRRPGR
eukprot:scaffold7266_cov403-Prasinococcus_capsulatus_cf.AAC.9